jgi:hypothetical protein
LNILICYVVFTLLGNSPHRPCVLYSTLGSKPPWGLKNSVHNFKGILYCCKIKRKGKTCGEIRGGIEK